MATENDRRQLLAEIKTALSAQHALRIEKRSEQNMNGYVTVLQVGETFVAFGLDDDNKIFVIGGNRPFPTLSSRTGE